MDNIRYKLAKICKLSRKRNKLSQQTIVLNSGFKLNTIASFERGTIKNIEVFLWYYLNILNDEEKNKFIDIIRGEM